MPKKLLKMVASKKFMPLGLAIFFATTTIVSLIYNPKPASAAVTEWQNRGIIVFNDNTYSLDLTRHAGNREVYTTTTQSCHNNGSTDYPDRYYDAILVNPDGSNPVWSKVDETNLNTGGNTNCETLPEVSINLAHPERRHVWFYRQGDTIYSFHKKVSFVKAATGVNGAEVFYTGTGACADYMVKEASGRWILMPMMSQADISNVFPPGQNAKSEDYNTYSQTSTPDFCKTASQKMITVFQVGGVQTREHLIIDDYNVCGPGGSEEGIGHDLPKWVGTITDAFPDIRINELVLSCRFEEVSLDTNDKYHLTVPTCYNSGNEHCSDTSNGLIKMFTEDFTQLNGDNGYVLTQPVSDIVPNAESAPLVVDTGNQAQATCASVNQKLGWIMCPAIESMTSAVDGLDRTILCLLKIDTAQIFNDNTGASCKSVNGTTQQTSDAYRKAWGVFRNIALALLVIFGLIMVGSQILGMEIFDAYAIRKMLPRLIVAVIILTLSWNLMQFLFTMSNSAADAIMDLIRTPFRGIDPNIGTDGTGFTLGVIIAGIATPAALIGAGAYAAFLGLGGVLALVGTVLLAIFSAWLLLIARNVAATLIIIVSPIAIICAAFEPFKKVYTAWKALLVTILLSVPIVAAVIEASHVGAFISKINGGASGIIGAIAIFVAGYALIWVIFKKLDSVAGQLGNVLGGVTDKARKGLANYRANAIKQRSGLWKQGGLFNERSFLGRTFNDVGRRVGAAQAVNATRGGGGYTGAFVGRNRRALMSTYDNVVRANREKDPMLAALANNDAANAVLAGSGGVDTDEALARSAANAGLTGDAARNAISAARAVGVNRANAMTALRTTMQNKARGVSAGNVRFMDQAVRALSGNEQEYSGLAYEAAFYARSNGRADLGGTDWISYQTQGAGATQPWQQARAVVEAEDARRVATGGAPMSNQERDTVMWQALADTNVMNGIERVGVQAMVGGHDNQIIQVMDTLARVLETSTNPQDRLQAAVAIKEIQGNMPAGASGSVRDAINRVLYNAPTDPGRPGLGLNASGNIAQQLAVRAGLDGTDGATAGQTLTTMGRTYGEYTGAEEAARRAAGGTP